jgi:hypothetical protein
MSREIKVRIIVSASGKRFHLTTQDDIPAERIMYRLTHMLKCLTPISASGLPLHYRFFPKGADQPIDNKSSFGQAGVRPDDLLEIRDDLQEKFQ